MADNKDRGRGNHRPSYPPPLYCYSHSSSSSRSGRLLNNNTSKTAASRVGGGVHGHGGGGGGAAAAAAAAAAVTGISSLPCAVVVESGAFTACSSSSSSPKKKLKLILKLPTTTTTTGKSPPPPLPLLPPASDSAAAAAACSSSSPSSSDPYGFSPPSSQHLLLPNHCTTSIPSPRPSSVNSAHKKIPSSSPSLPTSRRSALPFPTTTAVVAAAAPGFLPTTATLAPLTLPSVAKTAAAIWTATATTVASWAPTAITPAVGSADAEIEAKPLKKKRRLEPLTDPVTATPAAATGHQIQHGKSVPAAGLGLMSQATSGFAGDEFNLKDRGIANSDYTRSISRLLIGQPLPSKIALEGILDKLQKKDTYGVFSEPVDATEVQDYYDVIKEPMDFGTMRKKILRGDYVSLDLFQKDIFLICSNAMQYNARDTIYYKQARSILDATRKNLEALRTGLFIGDQKALGKQWAGGSSTKKLFKKPAAGKLLYQPTGSDYASGATLATRGESGTVLPDSIKGGKGLISNIAGNAGWNVDSQAVRGLSSSPGEIRNGKQDDLAGSPFRLIMPKECRRPNYDENRRNSYRPYSLQSHKNMPALLDLGGKQVQLIPMGHQPEYSYARSLARFVGDLGPAVWKVAVGKIGKALPTAIPFGPGWIGEQEAMAGGLPNRLSKEQLDLSKQSEVKTQAAENGQSGYEGLVHPMASRSSVKYLTELQGESVVKVTSSVAASVPERSILPNENSVSAIENSGMQHTAQAMQFNRSSTGESIKLSAGAAKFDSSELPESKLLELVSQKSELMQWAAGKQLKQDPQSLPSANEQTVHERGTEVSGDANFTSNSCSSAAEGALDLSKHDFDLRGQALEMSKFASSQDPCIQSLNMSSFGSEEQQLSQGLLKQTLHLCSTSGPTSVVLSTTGVTSASTSIRREDRGKQLCVQPQAVSVTHIGNDMITTLESQLPGSAIQNQMGGVSQFVPKQMNQTNKAHQQYEDQVRTNSQLYDSQWLLSSFPPNQTGGDMQLISQQETQKTLIHQWQRECQARTTSQLYDNQRPFSVQHQMGGSSKLALQDNIQTGLGHQPHEHHQSRIMSHLYDNQRLLSSTQFIQHQRSCDASTFVQQPVHLHPQGSSKLASPLVHSGSPSSCDANLVSLHPRFSNSMVAGLPSFSQPWRFVSLQYPLPQASNLSHSLPPDLNVSLQTPKSPLDQLSNSLTDSQQPDLALQL